MPPLNRFGITILGAGCALVWTAASAADVEPQNPPRSQEQIMKERYAACRHLHGDALAECMANYVGKAEKNAEPDSTPAPTQPAKEPTQGDARK